MTRADGRTSISGSICGSSNAALAVAIAAAEPPGQGVAAGGGGSGGGVGPRATSLRPGARSQAEIIASLPRAFYVQSVSGLHSGTSTVSGDFSVGASGLTITNGQVGAPIREFTIASTVQRMLLDVVEVGNDIDWLPMRAAGVSLVISDVTMSGA